MLSVLSRPSDRPALVRGDHVTLSARARHIRAEALQQQIRHAGEKANARRLQLVNESSNFNHHFIPSRARYVTYRNMCKTGLTFFATFPSSTILTPNRENRSELSSHDFPYGLLGAPAVPSKPIRRLVEDVGAVSCWTR